MAANRVPVPVKGKRPSVGFSNNSCPFDLYANNNNNNNSNNNTTTAAQITTRVIEPGKSAQRIAGQIHLLQEPIAANRMPLEDEWRYHVLGKIENYDSFTVPAIDFSLVTRSTFDKFYAKEFGTFNLTRGLINVCIVSYFARDWCKRKKVIYSGGILWSFIVAIYKYCYITKSRWKSYYKYIIQVYNDTGTDAIEIIISHTLPWIAFCDQSPLGIKCNASASSVAIISGTGGIPEIISHQFKSGIGTLIPTRVQRMVNLLNRMAEKIEQKTPGLILVETKHLHTLQSITNELADENDSDSDTDESSEEEEEEENGDHTGNQSKHQALDDLIDALVDEKSENGSDDENENENEDDDLENERNSSPLSAEIVQFIKVHNKKCIDFNGADGEEVSVFHSEIGEILSESDVLLTSGVELCCKFRTPFRDDLLNSLSLRHDAKERKKMIRSERQKISYANSITHNSIDFKGLKGGKGKRGNNNTLAYVKKIVDEVWKTCRCKTERSTWLQGSVQCKTCPVKWHYQCATGDASKGDPFALRLRDWKRKEEDGDDDDDNRGEPQPDWWCNKCAKTEVRDLETRKSGRQKGLRIHIL